MLTDPISDYLTRIRNTIVRGKKFVEIPGSNNKEAMTKILKEEGFINNYEFIPDNKQGIIKIELRYDEDDKPMITGLKKISKPGRRVYKKANELPRVLNGIGIAIVSTSKGLLTDEQAREENIGGEILCYIW